MGECCFCGKKLSVWNYGYAKGSLYDSEGWSRGSPDSASFFDLTRRTNVSSVEKQLTKYWLCPDCRKDYLNLLGLEGNVTETSLGNNVTLYSTNLLRDISKRKIAAQRILEKTHGLTKLDNFSGSHVHKLIDKMQSDNDCIYMWDYMSSYLQSYWDKFSDEHPLAIKNQILIFDPPFKTSDWTRFDFSTEKDGEYQTRWLSKDTDYFYLTMFPPVLVDFIKNSYEFRKNFEEDINKLYENYFNYGEGDAELVQAIPLNDIVFFYKAGDVSFTTETYGGGGNTINVGGAVKGAILAGAVGAYIGGQKGVNQSPIYTTTKKHDDRCVILRIRDENGGMKELVFKKEMYEHFMALIPEKEITNINCQAAPQAEEITSDPIEKIKGLKSLLDLGAITQEEFDEKKKQLLNSI